MYELNEGLEIIKIAASKMQTEVETTRKEFNIVLAAIDKIASIEEENSAVVIAKNAIYDILQLRQR